MPTPDFFLTLPENKLAAAAVNGMVGAVRNSPQPLIYLHGPSGSGKTLLLRQALRDWRKKYRGHSAEIIDAGEFALRYAEACEHKQADLFLKPFLKHELFICEDVQTLEGRASAQRALTLLVDELGSRSVRVVLTADHSPGQFVGLHAKLLNRIRGGLVVAIHLPSKASRMQLLEAFSQHEQLPLPSDSIELLARALHVSPRELKSVVAQLEHQVRVRKIPLDKAFVKRFLNEETAHVKISPKQIVRSTAQHFGLSEEQILSTSRRQSLVAARRCALVLSAELSGLSHTAIAKYFGRDNHSCVSQACRYMKKQLSSDPVWKQHWSAIHRLLKISDLRASD
ncbi:MAG: DnaA ATPase domain-containing protein [Planctomycetaceae bacterium]